MQNSMKLSWTGRRLGLSLVVIIVTMLALGGWANLEASADSPTIGLPQFQQLWDQVDKPVQAGKASRSYVWGPTVTGLLTEPYTEGGTRQVQYFDKTRMEQTAGRSVTNGLLVKEMITGLLQLGDNNFQAYPANSTNPIAGDPGKGAVTYASFRKVSTIDLSENRAVDQTGQVIAATINPDGSTAYNATFITQYNVRNAFFESTLGHNVPDVFFDFMNQTGLIYQNGNYTNGTVFNWISTIGLPLSEAYWSKFQVAGKTQDVLVQAFERRVLTYTPANPDAYKVEMGNVGQHYYQWRQIVTAPAPTPTPVPPTPVPTTPPAASSLPLNPAWQNPILLGSATSPTQPLYDPAMKIRPTDGVAFVLGSSGSGTGKEGYPGNALLLGRSDAPTRFQNIDDSANPANNKLVHLAFAPNGTAFVVYRHWPQPDDYRAYMRVINPDGSLQHGFDLGALYKNSGGAGYLDFPDVAYSASGKLYVAGEVQTSSSSRSIGFAQSSDGGNSWSNFFLTANNANPRGQPGLPKICVDGSDNVHLVYYANGSVYTVSRVNGQWTAPYLAADSKAQSWLYRGNSSIACGPDGTAYAIWDGRNSFGLAHFTPGQGWKTLSQDVNPKYDARNFSAVVTPDNRLWVAVGYYVANSPNAAAMLVSTDHGQTFSAPQTVISHSPSNTGVNLAYSSKANKLFYQITFADPRQSYLTITK